MIINFYSRQKKYLIGFFLFILLVFVPSEQADDKPIELVTGKPLIQQWLLGQTYKYQISLLAGQYIEINLQEAKSNEPLLESIKVFQGGKLIIEAEEIVSFTAEKSANYQIEVKAKDELDDPDAKHISKEYSLKLTTSELNLVKIDLPLLAKKAFQDYEARFYGKEEKGAFELLKNNSRIYLQKGGRFWLGEEEFNDEKAKQTDLVNIGKDITGDGQADLVIQEANNEECCRKVYIYQIGKEFKHISTIYVGEFAEVQFDDLDGDNLTELILTDDTFSFWEVTEVSPPIPSVVLKFHDGAYHLAKELMYETPPSFTQLKNEAEKVKDSGWDEKLLEEAPWSQMVELIYAGHPGLAWGFLDLAWPSAVENSKTAKAEFLKDFQKQLAKSPYWSELQTLSNLTKPPIKVGFIDKTGQTVIEPKSETIISQFDEELSPVLVDDKYGYMDKTGKLVIKPQFALAGAFSDGLAVIGVEIKDDISYGYIDKSGNIVIKPQFADAKNFSEGLAVVGILVKDNLVYGYIDKTGKIVVKPQFAEAERFSEGLAVVGFEDKENVFYGYIDKIGKIIVKPQYDEVSDFSEGLALVGLEEDDESYSFGYIDKTGKVAIKLQYEEAEKFSNGLALVQIDGKYGYIDKTGKIIIQPQFDEAESFLEGLAVIQVKGKYGYIDLTGKTVITPQYDEARGFSEGLALIKTNGKYGYIDKTGKIIIKPQFDEAGDFYQGVTFILKPNN